MKETRTVFLLSCVAAVFVESSAWAVDSPVRFSVEPIIGYEFTQEVLPTPHSVTRLIYGGRATVGILPISGEAEYTHGVNTEDIASMTQSVTVDRVKVGLRSGFNLGSFFAIFFRAGGQASQEVVTQTTGGVPSTTTRPLSYAPYGGAGFRINLSRKLSISANVVAVIPDINDMSKNQYQTTAGFAIHLP